jgi:putative transposase
MARQARLDAPGALHHVMGRGIDGIPLFVNTKDPQDFIARVADLSSHNALKV